jgi:hypothetical protein
MVYESDTSKLLRPDGLLSRRRSRLLLSSFPLVTLVVLYASRGSPFPFLFAFLLVAVVLLFAFPLVTLCPLSV